MKYWSSNIKCSHTRISRVYIICVLYNFFLRVKMKDMLHKYIYIVFDSNAKIRIYHGKVLPIQGYPPNKSKPNMKRLQNMLSGYPP